MSLKKDDEKFLREMGIKPTNFEASRPSSKNVVIEWMRRNHIPLTKENYLHIAYMGQEIPEGAEENLPPEVDESDEVKRRLILTAFEKFFERLTPEEQRIVTRAVYKKLCEPPPDPQINLFDGEES